MCWAACDRLARIAAQLEIDDRSRISGAAAPTAMRAQDPGARLEFDSKQTFVGAFGGDDLDATALLLPDLGFIEATDPRFVSTLDRHRAELVRGDLVFRYRHADDFGVPANTFTMCSFWYVNALAAVGRLDRGARHLREPAAPAQQRAGSCPRTSIRSAANSGAIFRKPTAWSA